MYKNFQEVFDRLGKGNPVKVVVAAAEDVEILKALSETGKKGITEGILVGNAEAIKALVENHRIEGEFEIVNAPSEEEAVDIAVGLVGDGSGDLLMKGLVNSSIFMRAVLKRDGGLRTGRQISHMACYEIPEYPKLLFCTDSGINVAPSLHEKRDILNNALEALRKMGYRVPKVALLAANEIVDPKIQATSDAGELFREYKEGEFPECIIEGPLAFDVAFSPEAAKHKGIHSSVSGEVDLLLCPTIEVGNALGKSWLHFNHASWAGVVLGAKKPILMGSRSDTADVKVNGIGLACLMCQLSKEGKV